MKSYHKTQIGNAVTLHTCVQPQFKTMRFSAHFILPMQKETAATYGILPGIITRATRHYPSYALLNRRLSDLYGASLSTGVRKMGAFQVLRVTASGISNQYALNNENITAELLSLLSETVLTPLQDSDGLFCEEHFQQEKRQLLELKDSEFNDKIAYARRQCEALLFADSTAGIDRYGTRNEIEKMQREDLRGLWQTILNQARIELFALGACQSEDTAEFLSPFSSFGTTRDVSALQFAQPDQIVRKVEQQPVSQSKLSIGFRVNSGAGDRLLFQLMSAVFGGVPSSKLFQNVREKMGLCYYCSSSYSHLNRAMFVDSGVETAQIEQAEQAILAQLSALQQGELTEEELLSAKLALCNSMRSVGDSLGAIESWQLGQLFEPAPFTPRDAVAQLMSYTKDDVIRAAQQVHSCAVYVLQGTEGKE